MSIILTQEQITYAITILDKAIKGLASQDFMPSMRPNNTTCAYRGTGNKKCAVGHVIPDDHELIIRECNGISLSGINSYLMDTEIHNSPDPIFSPLPRDFWFNLQAAHDDASTEPVYQSRRMKHNLQDFYNDFMIPMSPEIQALLSTSSS